MNNQTELPILKTTEMITVREVSGRQAFTYQDMADALQVDPALIRKQYSRNADSWIQGETDVCLFDTGAGDREIRYFTTRGAMRFCRYVKSGRSDQLFNHLLDLWEEERNETSIAPRNTIAELDAALNAITYKIAPKVVEMDTRLSQVEEHCKQTNPLEIERRMHFLKNTSKVLVAGTKGKPQPVTYQKFWIELKNLIGINSFTNRAALTVEMMEKCVEYAKSWCDTRCLIQPSLFGEESGKTNVIQFGA